MRVEKRNGKYYLILTDGEIELSNDELRKHYNLSRYLEKGLQYAKGEDWTFGNLPEEFDSIIGVDIFIEDVKRFIKEKASQPNSSEIFKEVIDKLSRVANSNIKNPLMAKHKKSYEYLMAQLADVKGDLLSVEKSSALQSQKNEKLKPEKEAPKEFEDLFYDTDLVQPSIDILKELEPPLIDTDCNFIGTVKGVICVWKDELQRQGIIKHYSDHKIFASLIPQKIKRFSIDDSMFRKYQKKAEENYRTDIKTKVSAMKLSQDSH